MANPIKTVRIPVESHGLHPHKYNAPYLGTGNFMQAFPVYYQELRIGENDHPNIALFSRLNPVTVPAFVTGRYNFKSFFVPYTFVFRPWYHFDRGIEYKKVDGEFETYAKAPYCLMEELNKAFIADSNLCEALQNPVEENEYDFMWFVAVNNYTPYRCKRAGTEVLKILNGLGYAPTWCQSDKTEVNILTILAYIRVMLDNYFPGQYVGTSLYKDFEHAIQPEKSHYDQADMVLILRTLRYLAQIYYDRSVFDMAWDSPNGPTEDVSYNPITFVDPSLGLYQGCIIDNGTGNRISSVNVDDSPNTPENSASIQNNDDYDAELGFFGRITQYSLNALSAIANYLRRNQLAGSRLIDNFLAARGVKLGKVEAQTSFFLNENNVEIVVDAVENNSNDNLGELAGKGVAFTEPGKPMRFECSAQEDGIMIVVCSLVPDSDMPVYNDPNHLRVNQMQFYHAGFDKVGVTMVPQYAVVNSMNGSVNYKCQNRGFGFLNQYYEKLIEKVTLTGDFRLGTRGKKELSAYHAFRIFDDLNVSQNNGVYHSLNFIAGYSDSAQYQRMFYADEDTVDNFMLFLRIFGTKHLEKLPLGDSFDWDDDEYNKKVEIINQGMKG